jgi:hypothetical protein
VVVIDHRPWWRRWLPARGLNGASEAHALQSHSVQAGEREALQRLLADREATIADLRRRLDSLTAVLTDRRPWWRRWFR